MYCKQGTSKFPQSNKSYNIFAGCSPLHYASGNGYLEISRYLIEEAHANMAQKTNKGHTPRYMAKTRGQTKLVAFFNEMGKALL